MQGRHATNPRSYLSMNTSVHVHQCRSRWPLLRYATEPKQPPKMDKEDGKKEEPVPKKGVPRYSRTEEDRMTFCGVFVDVQHFFFLRPLPLFLAPLSSFPPFLHSVPCFVSVKLKQRRKRDGCNNVGMKYLR